MSSLVERLRAGHQYSGIVDPLDEEAADRIEKLEAALTTFAKAAEGCDELGRADNDYHNYPFTAGQFRRARAVLAAMEPKP